MPAELLVLVAAQTQFGGKPLALETMLDKGSPVPAAVFVKIGAAVYPVLVPVGTDHQAILLIERQVVLPTGGVAVGVELAGVAAELVALLIAVLAVAQFQA
ncbi:hypothetical protein D3C77_615080 [compost metagenome]